MKIKHSSDSRLIRLERGEEVIKSLTEFTLDNQIAGAFFHGLGGASSASLGIYRLSEDKEYHFTDFEGDLEIISMNGNISTNEDGEIMIHCHSSISGNDLRAYGGHVKSLVVAGTCEIFVDVHMGALQRKLDQDIGLKLLDL